MTWWKRTQRGPAATAAEDRRELPAGVWTKCKGCNEILLEGDLAESLNVCPRCGFHHPMTAQQRLELLLDPDSFEELGGGIESVDPLGFRDTMRYADRIRSARRRSGLSEAVICGTGALDGRTLAIGVMAFEHMGGSMGSVVGERLTRMFERAAELRCPAIVSSASGGARMQEGILSLMQMAKTSAALRRLKALRQPYISIMHHPTTGGVAASFSMLGDVHIAEPGALIGFAGPRVIEQTIRETLPPGFQRSEFLLEHGMLDMIVPRAELRPTVARLLRLFAGGADPAPR